MLKIGVVCKWHVVNPTSLPDYSKIYWSDWNRDAPKIEMANMDGTDRRVVIDTGLGLPNGLTLDSYRQELCWSDAGKCSDTDKGNGTAKWLERLAQDWKLLSLSLDECVLGELPTPTNPSSFLSKPQA